MTVSDLSKLKNFDAIVLPQPDREITGVYIGDLLSWVMGRASEGDAWITIMSNVNILAVASLADTACIILSESVMPENDIIEVAKQRNINLVSYSGDTYAAATELSKLL